MSTTTDAVALPRRIAVDAAPTSAIVRRRTSQVALHAAFIAACAATLFPLLWMVRTAFAPSHDVFRATLSLWPDNATLGNFAAAFRLHPVGTWFVNSVVVAGAITLGKLALAVPAGFAFSVLSFRGRDAAFALVVGTMTVPYVITLLPTYVAVASIGLYDTLTGVIVPAVGHCGFVVFFLRQAFKALPRELFEAARIDGAGPWRQMLTIALPNIWGAVAAMAVLSFLGAWNLYLWPHLILDATEHKTLSIGLKLFATTGEQGGEWGPLMATALLAALPVVLLYLVAQRQLVSAFATSGIR
ncbi:MAG: carbohydrate ABC transporter permease [Reyranella sp.]|nr:carbohydrate ABC transporter permease [Reyranella sp.]MBL6653129.1 carbohydrate ABC transporter permease [Reyranella sp.]